MPELGSEAYMGPSVKRARIACVAVFVGYHAAWLLSVPHVVLDDFLVLFVSAVIWRAAAIVPWRVAQVVVGLVAAAACLPLGFVVYGMQRLDALLMAIFVRSPGYAWVLASHVVSPWRMYLFACVVTVGVAVLLRYARWPLPSRYGRRFFLLGICVWAWRGSAALSPDLTLMVGAHTFYRRGHEAPELPPPGLHRAPPPQAAAKNVRGRAVVWILHESVGASMVAPWTASSDAQELALWAQQHPERAVFFLNAVSQAAHTPISGPSMFTGLAPDASRTDYASAAFAWHWLDPSLQRSVFVSPQLYGWVNLDKFYFGSRPPAHVHTAEHMQGTPLNDGGVPDQEATDLALQISERVWREYGELYLFVQYNATHQPCWHPGVKDPSASSYDPSLERDLRCKEAVHFVHREELRLFDGLERLGILDQAWVISTSDHGESISAGALNRGKSVDEEVLRVPLMIAAPKTWAAAHPEPWALLQANAEARVSNADILPTVIDALANQLAPFELWMGQSLLQPVRKDRTLYACTDVPIRRWPTAGCAVYNGTDKAIVDVSTGQTTWWLTGAKVPTQQAQPAPAATPQWFRDWSAVHQQKHKP